MTDERKHFKEFQFSDLTETDQCMVKEIVRAISHPDDYEQDKWREPVLLMNAMEYSGYHPMKISHRFIDKAEKVPQGSEEWFHLVRVGRPFSGGPDYHSATGLTHNFPEGVTPIEAGELASDYHEVADAAANNHLPRQNHRVKECLPLS